MCVCLAIEQSSVSTNMKKNAFSFFLLRPSNQGVQGIGMKFEMLLLESCSLILFQRIRNKLSLLRLQPYAKFRKFQVATPTFFVSQK